MTAPISIILPVLNSADRMGPTLHRISLGLDAGLIAEVILADGGSRDDTEKIAELTGASFVPCPTGRGSQLAHAATTAKAKWLLFLHDDTLLPEDWPQAVAACLSQPDQPRCFRLQFDDESFAARWLSGWANWRTRWLGMPYGDQGLLISRKAYERAGGFQPIPLMEDVDLVRRLRPRPKLLKTKVMTSAERYRRNGWLRQSFSNGVRMARYYLGATPEKLARRYDGSSLN